MNTSVQENKQQEIARSIAASLMNIVVSSTNEQFQMDVLQLFGDEIQSLYDMNHALYLSILKKLKHKQNKRVKNSRKS